MKTLTTTERLAFIDELRSFLAEHGLTRADFTRVSGINQPTLSCWMAGKYLPQTPRILKCREAMHRIEHPEPVQPNPVAPFAVGQAVYETRDLDIAAYLVMMGAVMSKVAPIPGQRVAHLFTLTHPDMDALVADYKSFKPVTYAPAKLMAYRQQIKRLTPRY